MSLTGLRILAPLALLLVAGPVSAEEGGEHVMMPPAEVAYQAGPPSLPEGAQFAVLYGDPSAEGLFAMRLKLPDGYAIPPHIHPKPEAVTVISGAFLLGAGEEADHEATTRLEAGSFFAMEPGMAHYAVTDGETVVQLNSVGPWGIEYINPEDDPRS